MTPIPRITPFAAPTITLGTANAAGSAPTAVRTDATLLAFDATDPTTIAYGGAADVGTEAVGARRDHGHGMPAALGSQEITASRTAAAGSGAQAITGAGFAPLAVIINACVDGDTFGSIGQGSDDLAENAIGSNLAGNYVAHGGQIVAIDDGTNKMEAVLTSLDADGCTITWTKTASGMNVNCHLLFLGPPS